MLLLTFLVSVVVHACGYDFTYKVARVVQCKPGACASLLDTGGGLLGLFFAGYVPLASQSPYPIIVTVYSVVNYRPHLSHFWAKV